MARQIWWQKPQIRTDEELHLHRRGSWLELFFDLVFVAIIAELSHKVFARSIITFLWWWGGDREPSFRPTAKLFAIGSSISIALFIIEVCGGFFSTNFRLFRKSRGARSAEFAGNIGSNSDELRFVGRVSLVPKADPRSSKIIGAAL